MKAGEDEELAAYGDRLGPAGEGGGHLPEGIVGGSRCCSMTDIDIECVELSQQMFQILLTCIQLQ